MAEDTKAEAQTQSAKGGGGGMLPALLVIVLMPVISFAMFKFLFVPMIKAELPEPGAAAAQLKPEDVHIQSDGGKATYEATFDNVVTNVKGTSQTRFVQVSFSVYSAHPDLEAEVNRNRTRLLDVTISVLGNLTLADLERGEIKNTVRNQLKQGFDFVMGKPMIEEIYFSQFVTQ